MKTQAPFRKYNLDEENKKVDSFTVKLNKEERLEFEQWKIAIQQTKDSSALKQLARIGSEVILDNKTKAITTTILNNYRKNKRLNIVDFE